MVTHQIIWFPYGSWFATRDLPPGVAPSKSVRESDTKNRPRIVALMARVCGRVGIFNPVVNDPPPREQKWERVILFIISRSCRSVTLIAKTFRELESPSSDLFFFLLSTRRSFCFKFNVHRTTRGDARRRRSRKVRFAGVASSEMNRRRLPDSFSNETAGNSLDIIVCLIIKGTKEPGAKRARAVGAATASFILSRLSTVLYSRMEFIESYFEKIGLLFRRKIRPR